MNINNHNMTLTFSTKYLVSPGTRNSIYFPTGRGEERVCDASTETFHVCRHPDCKAKVLLFIVNKPNLCSGQCNCIVDRERNIARRIPETSSVRPHKTTFHWHCENGHNFCMASSDGGDTECPTCLHVPCQWKVDAAVYEKLIFIPRIRTAKERAKEKHKPIPTPPGWHVLSSYASPEQVEKYKQFWVDNPTIVPPPERLPYVCQYMH
jgi:hypothetical protein